MKLGLLVGYHDSDLDLLTRLGLESCELLVFPDSPLSPSRGAGGDDWKRARERFDFLGVEVSAVGAYLNMLAPDRGEREFNSRHIEQLFSLAEIMGCRTIGLFAGRDPERSPEECLPDFAEVFTPLARKAGERGLRLAIEGCPMFHGWPFRGINIAFTPAMWEKMFDAVPDPALGLEYDPSHLICLGIDYLRAIRDFAPRIFHVHAKDAEVLAEEVYRHGFFDGRASRHRMPGLGQADWRAIVSLLRACGYTGNLDIEGRHDPEYHGAREEEGLRIAVNHLRGALVADSPASGPAQALPH